MAAQILQEVTRVERMYDRKVAKAVKQQLKNENDPVACLRPSKANIDLKRSLETKLSQLSVKTDRSILEILSKFSISSPNTLAFIEEKKAKEQTDDDNAAKN